MDLIEEQLSRSKTIAVVGLSTNPERPSHYVAKYLQEQGYRVITVNPLIDEALGERSYPDLKSIPEPIDVVDIFRRSELVGPVVDEAIEVGAPGRVGSLIRPRVQGRGSREIRLPTEGPRVAFRRR